MGQLTAHGNAAIHALNQHDAGSRDSPWSHTHLVIAGTVWFRTISHIRSAVLWSVRNAFETTVDRLAILVQATPAEGCLGATLAWWDVDATSFVTRLKRLSIHRCLNCERTALAR